MVLCLACTTEEEEVGFASLADLKVHEMTGHPKPEKILPVDPRPPSLSKTEQKALEELEKEKVVNPPVEVVNQVVNKEWVPPVLRYKWEGRCQNCNTELRTIEFKNEGENTVIAYCVNCDKNIAWQNVPPLSFKKEETFEENLKGKKK